MPVNNLIQKFESLHQLSQELTPREETALRYLSSAPKDLDNTRIEGLLTLVKSISSLRQLAHLQLRETVLEVQSSIRASQVNSQIKSKRPDNSQSTAPRQINTQSQSTGHSEAPPSVDVAPLVIDHPSSGSSLKTPEREPDLDLSESENLQSGHGLETFEGYEEIEDAESLPDLLSPEYHDAFDAPTRIELSSHAEFSLNFEPFDETPPLPNQPMIDELIADHPSRADSAVEVSEVHEDVAADEELAALQREIASITQPVFGQPHFANMPQSPPINSLIPPSMMPSDVPSFVNDVVLRPDVLSTPDDPFSDVEPGVNHDSPSDQVQHQGSQGDEPHTDFSSVFPASAGEAGTATFDARDLKAAGIFVTPEPEIISQVKANFYALVSTPEISFEGLVHAISEREIFVKSREPLQRGEQVQLSFTLPGSREHISCSALVREVRSATEATQSHLVPGVKLRFLNLRSNQETLISEEVQRQNQS
jgi:hypothetical protein